MASDSKQNLENLEISFVPDVLRRRQSSTEPGQSRIATEHSNATLLWIDIFNFSPLCKRLMADTHSGVEKITGILKSHYDFLLEKVIEYGGEPLFFVGDGLMSAWFDDDKSKADTLRATACAKDILDKRYTQDDQEQKLSLHTVVSYGPWEMVELTGIHQSKLLSFYGEVFHDLTRASVNRAPDNVLITKAALDKLPGTPKAEAVKNNTFILREFPGIEKKPVKPPVELTGEDINALTHFAPRTIEFPISRERLGWISEIRPVTSVFVRLPDTSILRDDNINHLQHLGELAGPIVEKYDGLLNQIWMDDKDSNIFICFGPAPSAHVDNASRAVRLALELHEVLNNEGYTNGIGLCTGMAYCGIIGNDVLRQYTVIGDVVNMSARLSGLAKDGVLCDSETVRQTSQNISYTSIGKRQVKGRKSLMELHRPMQILEDNVLKSNIQALIGREKELEIILQAYNDAVAGRGTVMFLEGDSGMGKSRLIDVFAAQIPTGDRRLLRAQGDRITRETPYRLLSSAFMNLLGLDKMSYTREMVHDLDDLPPEYRDRAALLNIVLNTNFEDSQATKQLTGSQRAKASFDLLMEILRTESQKHPLVIAVDDSHWMDPSSWKLIRAVHEQLDNVLILLSYDIGEETEVINTLKDQGARTIIMRALPKSDQKRLLATSLGVESVTDEVVDIIDHTAKGNPFFCIELASSLRDQNYLVIEDNTASLNKDVEIGTSTMPETVRGALRNKIDRLQSGSRLTLKVGSVAGIRFARDLVHSIYPIQEEREIVPDFLNSAKRTGIINETPVDDELGYQFANMTAAEVAYEMTLAEQRRQLHRETARWYEDHFQANLVPFYVRLAHHWSEAGEAVKAARYKELEAVRLFRQGFVMPALEVGLQGVALLGLKMERTPETIGPKLQEHMGMIQQFMADREINSLVDHKKLENEVTDQLIQLILELTPFAHQGHQAELFALMALTTVRLTLEEGNGTASAEVYAMYAIIYKAFTGDSKGAYQWSKLALSMDEKNDHTRLARVGFIHCWFIAHWLDPVRSLIDLSQRSSMAGFESGDVVYGCFSLSLEVILKAVSGFKLNEVIDTAERHFQLNNDLVVNASFHLKHERQVAKAFQGLTTSYTSLTDDLYDEEKDIASICQTDLVNQIGYYFISKIKLAAHYANWDEAVDWAEKAQPLLPGFANQPGHAEFGFYQTLAQLYASHYSSGQRAEDLKASAEAGLQQLEAWGALSPANYKHKALIARAVESGLNGDITRADELFEAGISIAREQRYIQDVGLALEHQARLRLMHSTDASAILEEAINSYDRWGAHAKVKYLQNEFPLAAP